MPEKTRLTPTSERGNLIAWVDDNDMGWLMFVTQRGSTNIRCHGCGKPVTTGYMPRSGEEYRCHHCVEIVEEHDDA